MLSLSAFLLLVACGSSAPGPADSGPPCATLCGGECADLTRDSRHCGSCDVACGAGELCEAGACVPCGEGISFAGDVQPIFTASCGGAACHAGARPAGALLLESGSAHAELVGVASSCPDRRLLVDPGDADGSYLVQKITGAGICQGGRMPLTGPGLSAAQIDAIRGWVCGGARDD